MGIGGIGGDNMKNIYEGYSSFLSDPEKMHDFIILSMEEFLSSYSYLTVEDYYATYDDLMSASMDFYEVNKTMEV